MSHDWNAQLKICRAFRCFLISRGPISRRKAWFLRNKKKKRKKKKGKEREEEKKRKKKGKKDIPSLKCGSLSPCWRTRKCSGNGGRSKWGRKSFNAFFIFDADSFKVTFHIAIFSRFFVRPSFPYFFSSFPFPLFIPFICLFFFFCLAFFSRTAY